MKKYGWLFLGLISGIFLTFVFLWTGSINNALAEPSGPAPGSSPTPESPWKVDGMTSGPLGSDGNGDETPPAGFAAAVLGPSVLATPVPGESLVYFVPTDNDASATVIYLYNTDTAAHVVALRGYAYNGVLVYSLNINVGASSFLRLVSDSVAAAPPPSWATPAAVITNFTDFTYFASLSLPKGVKAEGYVLFNPGTGVINPRLDQGAIPLRFSTDPASVFLPSVQAGS